MKRYSTNEKGLTLLEVLLSIVIGSILVVLTANILIFASNQYNAQRTSSANLYDVTYAAKVITKEIRKSNQHEIETVGTNHLKLSNGTEFKHNDIDKMIEREDGSLLVKEIESFYIERVENKVKLQILSTSGKSMETEIVLRGGN